MCWPNVIQVNGDESRLSDSHCPNVNAVKAKRLLTGCTGPMLLRQEDWKQIGTDRTTWIRRKANDAARGGVMALR
jgi:hypothetical protein